MKTRAYFTRKDRGIIQKWANMNRSDSGLILVKLNEERSRDGLPTFKMKALVEEIRRGGGDDRTGDRYSAQKAEKNYRIGKNKWLPFFDERSSLVLRYFLLHCKMNIRQAYIEYSILYKRGKSNILKLHCVKDIEWLGRQGYLDRNTTNLFNAINMEVTKLQDRGITFTEMKPCCMEQYLLDNPDYGRWPIYGEPPLCYREIDEVTGEPIRKVEPEPEVKDEVKEEIKETVSETILDPSDKDDVTTISLPAGGKVRIVNTASNIEYQIIRKGNEFMILL